MLLTIFIRNAMFKRLVIVFAMALFSGLSFAGTTGYQCVVVDVMGLRNDGKMKSYPKNPEIGRKFAVSRSTGEVIGEVSFGMNVKPQVLGIGSKDNSFKVMWTAQAGGKSGMHVDLLTIEEFVVGPKKPFIVTVGSFITTGICE
jgi:hypothetical protein